MVSKVIKYLSLTLIIIVLVQITNVNAIYYSKFRNDDPEMRGEWLRFYFDYYDVWTFGKEEHRNRMLDDLNKIKTFIEDVFSNTEWFVSRRYMGTAYHRYYFDYRQRFPYKFDVVLLAYIVVDKMIINTYHYFDAVYIKGNKFTSGEGFHMLGYIFYGGAVYISISPKALKTAETFVREDCLDNTIAPTFPFNNNNGPSPYSTYFVPGYCGIYRGFYPRSEIIYNLHMDEQLALTGRYDDWYVTYEIANIKLADHKEWGFSLEPQKASKIASSYAKALSTIMDLAGVLTSLGPSKWSIIYGLISTGVSHVLENIGSDDVESTLSNKRPRLLIALRRYSEDVNVIPGIYDRWYPYSASMRPKLTNIISIANDNILDEPKYYRVIFLVGELRVSDEMLVIGSELEKILAPRGPGETVYVETYIAPTIILMTPIYYDEVEVACESPIYSPITCILSQAYYGSLSTSKTSGLVTPMIYQYFWTTIEWEIKIRS